LPYANYAALAAAEVEGVDYSRTTTTVPGATWAAIAIHGGGIEAGSGEMAQQVAAGLMTCYVFAGLQPSNNFDLHITSTDFDEPNAVAIVAASTRTLSFHGFIGDPAIAETQVGGLDTALRDRVIAALQGAGFSAVIASSEIAGTDPTNICNENASSAGLQLEMSAALRASFFPGGDTSRAMRESGARTETFYRYARAVRAAYTGRGMVALTSVNVSRYCTQDVGMVGPDLTASVSTDALALGGSHFVALVARYLDTNNMYLARLEFSTTQQVILSLRKRVTGTETLLVSVTAPLTHAANRRFSIRFKVSGSTLRGKVWETSRAEPDGWDIETTDTALPAAGAIGMRSILSTANTNPLPVRVAWDDFADLTGSQLFSVERSINGVVKAHPIGADARLADPTYIAL
jgi:phage replication-related protein YjqB (UPF0714/DUF867 family)